MNIEIFDDFKVYSDDQNYVFIHLNLSDDEKFYRELFDYFFSEDKLLRHCENTKGIKFSPSKKAYTVLYKYLKNYIDTDDEIIIPDLDIVIENLLVIEGMISFDEGKKIARADKIGKIGEYICACMLMDYFKFDCILPKIHLSTDYNMSVYGIDEVFYSTENNILMFGESKVSMGIDNGITLLKESLKTYEKQIEDEYELVLSNRLYRDKLKHFHEKYGDLTEICLDMKEFIEEAGIKEIGIPLFVTHGTEDDVSKILDKMKKLPRKSILDLETKYYCISLPVIDKYKMIAAFKKYIKEKEVFYENSRKECSAQER